MKALGKRAFPLASAALAMLATGPRPAAGDETTYCDHYINSVPYTITKPGHYCLRGGLSTAITSGAAITIDADFVWVDMNNFVLDGSAAGPATEAEGIVTSGRRNLTVRNGTVRGFFNGVRLFTNQSGANYTVENIRADANTITGIAVFGTGNGQHVIRNNVVADTGGSTIPGHVSAFAIQLSGDGNVVNNEVLHVFGDASAGGTGTAFVLDVGTAIASGNRVSGADVGFMCFSAGKYLRDNVVVVTTRAYDPLCTRVGLTNYP